MVRSRISLLILAFVLCCSIASATVGYKMRYNPQTGRGDWVIDETTLPEGASPSTYVCFQGVLSAEPDGLANGCIYINSTTSGYYVYYGTDWQLVATLTPLTTEYVVFETEYVIFDGERLRG